MKNEYSKSLALVLLALCGIFGAEPAVNSFLQSAALDTEDRVTAAIAFLAADTPKVFGLLSLVVFLMSFARSWIAPEKIKKWIGDKTPFVAHGMAALLGCVTPFCTCSAVPVFVGFVSGGIPLGVTFTFLIAAPMVNEVVLGLLFGLVGAKTALVYALFGLLVACVGGVLLGALRLDAWLEPWVLARRRAAETQAECAMHLDARFAFARKAVTEILGRVWIWMLIGLLLGAGIHGFVPVETVRAVLDRDAWWSVPAATLAGVPLYANGGSVVPFVSALLQKGAPLGTAVSFMMAATALSLPEAMLLRQAMSWRLVAVYFTIVTLGILGVGYVMNALFV